MFKQLLSVRRLAFVAAAAVLLAACGGDDVQSSADGATNVIEGATNASDDSTCFADPGLEAVELSDADLSGTQITLATHDSFALSEETLAAFTEETGIEVEQVAVGDAGQLVSQAVLTQDTPTADVMFGIDNSFLCRGLEAGLFTPFASDGLATVSDELQLDPFNRVTPIDLSLIHI